MSVGLSGPSRSRANPSRPSSSPPCPAASGPASGSPSTSDRRSPSRGSGSASRSAGDGEDELAAEIGADPPGAWFDAVTAGSSAPGHVAPSRAWMSSALAGVTMQRVAECGQTPRQIRVGSPSPLTVARERVPPYPIVTPHRGPPPTGGDPVDRETSDPIDVLFVDTPARGGRGDCDRARMRAQNAVRLALVDARGRRGARSGFNDADLAAGVPVRSAA